MVVMSQQLALRIALRDEAIFNNYWPGPNAELLRALQLLSEKAIYFYGPPGVGCTHLLQAICHQHHFFYLPLAEFKSLSPEIFEGLEHQAGLCVDNIEVIAGDRLWEEAFFHFYNRARSRNLPIIMSARVSPKQLSCVLPDLQSRLCAALIYEVKPLSDQDKAEALQLHAGMRGFTLSDDVLAYLIHHYSRNMSDLMIALDALDRASLCEKRRITIPFLKEVLRNMLTQVPEEGL